jgi:hypothetical protein
LRFSRARELSVVLLVILVLALAGYGRLLRPGRVPYSAHSDIVALHLATKTVLYDSIRSGRGLPFWRDDEMSGLPAFTNPESQYLYPLHALFYVLKPVKAVGPTIWIQLVAGALAFYWVGAVLGLGRPARLLMAVAQLFNFKLIAITYAGFLPVLPIVTLLPLLFASLFDLMDRPDPKRALVLSAVAAVCLSTGGFQLLYDAAIPLCGYLAWQMVTWWRAGRPAHAGKVALGALAAGAAAFGLMACQLVPMLAESALLSRNQASYRFFLSGYTLTLRHLLGFLRPEAFGRLTDATRAGRYLWEDTTYFGIIPLALAIVGAVRGWRRRHVPFLVAGFVATLLLATASPFTRLLYETLPGFGLFRMPIRFVYLTGLFGIALAGVGLEETMAMLRRRSAAGRPWSSARALPAVLLVLMAAEGVFYAHRYVRTKPEAFVLPTPGYAAFFAADTTTFRIAPAARDVLQPGWAAPLHLQLVTGGIPYNLADYGDYLEMLETGRVGASGTFAWAYPGRVARPDLLDALNVKYVVSPVPLREVGQAGFHEAAHLTDQPVFAFFQGMTQGDMYIYRNDRFLERAFWVKQVVGAGDRDAMIAAMIDHDLVSTAIVHGDAAPGQAAASSDPGTDDRVAVVSSSAGDLALDTHTGGRRFLVISEIRHPGWRASLDGADLPLAAADLALMGAWIPAGDHHVLLRFRPLRWPFAAGLSIVFAVLWSAAALALWWRSRRDSGRDPAGAS